MCHLKSHIIFFRYTYVNLGMCCRWLSEIQLLIIIFWFISTSCLPHLLYGSMSLLTLLSLPIPLPPTRVNYILHCNIDIRKKEISGWCFSLLTAPRKERSRLECSSKGWCIPMVGLQQVLTLNFWEFTDGIWNWISTSFKWASWATAPRVSCI